MSFKRVARMVAVLLGTAVIAPAHSAPAELANALRHGGYVLLMRHASSPANPPDRAAADPQNVGDERQLDEKGRASARDMGDAFRTLHIPVGQVFSSPTYRARETVRLADLGTPVLTQELGDQGHSMARITGAGPVGWLKNKVSELPPRGRNTILVTHMPNIAAAFPDQSVDLKDGETLVFKPDGHGHAELVAKVEIGDWPQMAK
jgi:phosphohistidine phosphatase SixA